MKCRHCGAPVNLPFIDLGSAPPSNAYLTAEQLHAPESWYPLRVLVCAACRLVQTEDYAQAEELFSPEYAYFSSYSSTWLSHAENYVDSMVRRFNLTSDSLVAEIASNDGYLLQYVQARRIPCFGVEPTAGTAAAARSKGIETIEAFFGERLAGELAASGRQADVIAANNVLAHVPDLNDFVTGFHLLLKPQGVATFEFPHLVELVTGGQFDTIYHEHYSYFSLTVVAKIFRANGLAVFDVEKLPTHGGSLRVYAQRTDSGAQPLSERVTALLSSEMALGVETNVFYDGFQRRAEAVKNDLLFFLLESKREGRKVAAYGAAAKGNTLLNFAGVKPDLLPYVVDRNPAKQGKFLPGSRIPIVSEETLKVDRPAYVCILPWNLREEIMSQLAYILDWGGRFVTAVPSLEVQ